MSVRYKTYDILMPWYCRQIENGMTLGVWRSWTPVGQPESRTGILLCSSTKRWVTRLLLRVRDVQGIFVRLPEPAS